jgi:DNA-binding transcriptional regulator YhcF (GntR family)
MADDPDDTRALYQRVIDDIRMRIGIGHLSPGDQLPGAAQLAEEFGYAHMTIQRALQELKRDGILYSVKGKGTFIHPKAKERMQQEAAERISTGPIEITSDEQADALTAEYQAKIQAALTQAEEAIASGDPERIARVEADMEKVYVEISPAVAATHLYMMRKFVGHGLKVPAKDLTIPAPGTPTYNWAFYGDPNLSDEQIDEIIRKRTPRKKPDTNGPQTDDAGDSES